MFGFRQKRFKVGVHEVIINDPGRDLPPFLYWAEKTSLRLYLPLDMLRMHGAFGYGNGWNPLVAALEEGEGALRWFYDRFQPATISDTYFLLGDEPGLPALPPWELPWVMRIRRAPPPGEKGLPAEHGISYMGPASSAKVALEVSRLRETAASVDKHGFSPDKFGDITGFFIRRGAEFRFFVRGGKHRVAVLARLGHKKIPVQWKSFWPRVVTRDGVADWPLVREGKISERLAGAILDRYVDFDGSQQWELLTQGTGHAWARADWVQSPGG